MKIIYQIAKTELKIFFCSPIAWFVLVIFAFQSGMVFSDVFEEALSRQVMKYWNIDLSRNLFSSLKSGVFPAIQTYLFIYVPILTMGLISRETSSGSIKLLYSSPVTSRHIVLGKFLSMVSLGLIFCSVILIQIIFSAFTVDSFDIAPVISGLLGFFLLFCTYSAIGLFLSCLVSYQVIAAVGTIALLAVLNYIGSIGQDIPLVREVTYWLSISGRTDLMYQGLLCSEDVVYFLLIIVLFLSLSSYKLFFERKPVPVLRKISIYGVICVIAIGLGSLSFQPKLMAFYDTTDMKSNSLRPEYQEIMKKLKGGLTITSFVNLFDKHSETAFPKKIFYDKERLADFIRFKPEIKMKYVYYYNDGKNTPLNIMAANARKIAITHNVRLSQFLSPEQMKDYPDLSLEDYRFVRLIERENGEKTWLRVFDDISAYPSNAEVGAAFKKISMKLPKVAFLTGHDERNINRRRNKDYGYFSQARHFRQALINQGFDVSMLVLQEGRELNKNDFSVLVIADPIKPFQHWELDQLNAYICSGGNLLLAADENSIDIINNVANFTGLSFNNGKLLQPHEEALPDLIFSKVTTQAEKVDKSFLWMKKGNSRLVSRGVTSLQVTNHNGFNIIPVLETDSSGCWLTQSLKEISENPMINESLGEAEQNHTIAYALTRTFGTREQRIFAIGDADWISDGELNSQRRGIRSSNLNIAYSLFKWFSYGEVPLSNSRPTGNDNVLKFKSSQVPMLRILFWLVIPGILLITGSIRLIKRRRK